MTRGFEGRQCVLCPRPSTRRGEHVWPSWLIELFAADGPFRTDIDNMPVLNRDEVPSLSPAMPGVHVPMCVSCNDLLNRTIEQPVKEVVRRLPLGGTGGWPILDAEEAAALGRWFLKIILLQSHPDARSDDPNVDRQRRKAATDLLPEWVGWMSTDGEPPQAFSLYAARRDPAGVRGPWRGDKVRFHFPRTLRIDDRTHRYFSRIAGLAGLDVTAVWHPEWPFSHPLVDAGRAVGLWPRPSSVDLEAIGTVHPEEFAFVIEPVSAAYTRDQFTAMTKDPTALTLSPIERFARRYS